MTRADSLGRSTRSGRVSQVGDGIFRIFDRVRSQELVAHEIVETLEAIGSRTRLGSTNGENNLFSLLFFRPVHRGRSLERDVENSGVNDDLSCVVASQLTSD